MASTEQPADRDLIARTLDGDREAFAVLVRRYGRKVYARLSWQVRYPEDAEDLSQETFVKAYVQLAQLKDEDRFPSWLRAIADNEARMWHRRQYMQLRIEGMDTIPNRGQPPTIAPQPFPWCKNRSFLERGERKGNAGWEVTGSVGNNERVGMATGFLPLVWNGLHYAKTA